MNIKELDNKYVAPTYARFPVCITGGKGSLVYDDEGREYIDLGTGIAVNTFGVADDEWIAAVTAQLSAVQHTSNLYYSEPCARLAAELCSRTGMKRVFFSNSGAEANECAIKAARKYGEINKGEGYTTIITLKDSFHGRTLTTLAATGQDVFHKDFLPLTDGFVYAAANSKEDVIKLTSENKCCAVMFEVVQGEGGVLPLKAEFLTWLEDFAKKNDLLLIADEVQTGNGRTGELYGYMNFGISPDIVSTAKGLGGGLPIGATMLGEKVEGVLGAGMHGSTFGGNPVCAAGALNILSRLDGELLDGVKRKSEYIFSELEGAKGVKSVSGLGLMIGIECERPVSEIIEECREKGVLVIKAKQKVRLLPALNIDDEILIKAINILKEACAK
ncbi:MAG: acetylornithine/succinylornithine family transaminase [Ruminococcaceae bacterium]|nr:acetylornithine/succinylornithine family transaminase [Oscillospiraceae bacterium]